MSRVTEEGQVIIPEEVRDALDITPGDEVEFEETDAGYVLRKHVEEDRFERWRGVADTGESVEERMADLRGRNPDSRR